MMMQVHLESNAPSLLGLLACWVQFSTLFAPLLSSTRANGLLLSAGLDGSTAEM